MSLNTRVAAFFGAVSILLAGVMAEQSEGTRYVAYQDSGGIWTLCKGHTKGVKRGDTATPEQCDAWFRQDLIEANNAIDSCVKVKLSVQERAAMLDWTFNVGAYAACNSTLVRKVNSGDRIGACNEYPRWVYAGNQILPGLVKRRAAERDLCLQGIQ